jgi:hypothetical protein
MWNMNEEKWLENEAPGDWMKTGNDWSTPESCSRDSSVTQVA